MLTFLIQTTVYALYDLSTYVEYVKPLREELAAVSRNDIALKIESMPLLDSFVKESARFSTSDASRFAFEYSFLGVTIDHR